MKANLKSESQLKSESGEYAGIRWVLRKRLFKKSNIWSFSKCKNALHSVNFHQPRISHQSLLWNNMRKRKWLNLTIAFSCHLFSRIKTLHFNFMCQTKGLIGKQPKASRKFNHQISTEFNLSNLFLALKLYVGKKETNFKFIKNVWISMFFNLPSKD